MSTVLEQRCLSEAGPRRWGPWLAVGIALAVLYASTYAQLARGLWRDDAYAHGPIILALFAWLAWRERDALLAGDRAPLAGVALVLPGLALYVLGRSQGLALFEVASHLPLLAGIVLLLGGTRALKRLAVPLAFLVFLVPLPGFILDLATGPLKALVSVLVEWALRLAGVAVERSGVVLSVGGHDLLVADACSGLNSIYSMLALGLLYAHVTPPASRARSAWIAASVVPIAIVANVVRVLILVALMLYAGEEAAQGFLHGFAGMVVFLTALVLLLALDRVLRRRLRGARAVRAQPTATPLAARPVSRGAAVFVVAALAGAAVAAPLLKPTALAEPIDLERAVPAQFAGWRIDPEVVPVTPAPDVQANLDRIYRQVVNRTYVNGQGERMMLTVAYGGDQSDALKAHRQEACYAAQGFSIHGLRHGTLALGDGAIPVTRLVAVRGERVEPVTYWFTMGDRVVLGRVERLRAQLAAGLAGRVPDGMLVRVSNLTDDAPRAFAAQQAFVTALLAALPSTAAPRLVGVARVPE